MQHSVYTYICIYFFKFICQLKQLSNKVKKTNDCILKEHYRKYSSKSIKKNLNMQKIGWGEP